jgi:hypothetical protein
MSQGHLKGTECMLESMPFTSEKGIKNSTLLFLFIHLFICSDMRSFSLSEGKEWMAWATWVVSVSVRGKVGPILNIIPACVRATLLS